MKKIISGKKYDTDTAQEVGSCYFSNPGDFHHYSEKLYRKKTGEFFLYGEGGPMSKYAKQIELNIWSGGKAIIPLTYKEATEWGEAHLDGDEYEEVFGEVSESLEAITVTYSIPTAAAALIKREAEKAGKSQSSLITDLILRKYGPKES